MGAESGLLERILQVSSKSSRKISSSPTNDYIEYRFVTIHRKDERTVCPETSDQADGRALTASEHTFLGGPKRPLQRPESVSKTVLSSVPIKATTSYV